MTNKSFRIAATLIIACIITLVSCESNPEHNAKSTHVDSTNEHGTAPVQYGADNPTDTAQQLQPSDDTGRRSNTEQRQ
jgi:hypothetical protein